MKKYKAHNWYSFFDLEQEIHMHHSKQFRCPFKCTFCCINAPFESNQIRSLVVENIIIQR